MPERICQTIGGLFCCEKSITRQSIWNMFQGVCLNDMRQKPYTVNLPPTPIEKIIEFHYGLYLCYMNLSKDGRTLGKTCFDDGYTQVYDRSKQQMVYIEVEKGTIIIEADLLSGNLGRLRFTQCHEFAHWIAPPEILAGTQRQPALTDGTPDPEEKWIEWQANTLGRNLLLPLATLKPYFYHIIQNYHLDGQSIITKIADKYEASKQATAIQLYKHNLLDKEACSPYLT